LTASILGIREIEYFIKDWKLIPSDGGRFEFEVNDELLFSKKQLGRHAEEGEIVELFKEYIEKYKAEHGIAT
jgi:selenoprotein W-related protein